MSLESNNIVLYPSYQLTNIDSELEILKAIRNLHLQKDKLIHQQKHIKLAIFKSISAAMTQYSLLQLSSLHDIENANSYISKRYARLSRLRKSLLKIQTKIKLCTNLLILFDKIKEMLSAVDSENIM